MSGPGSVCRGSRQPTKGRAVVDRCVCHQVPFTHVRELHARGLSLEQIAQQTRCGTGCGLCQPYLAIVCATGRTRMGLMNPAQIAAVLAAARTASVGAVAPHAGSAAAGNPPACPNDHAGGMPSPNCAS